MKTTEDYIGMLEPTNAANLNNGKINGTLKQNLITMINEVKQDTLNMVNNLSSTAFNGVKIIANERNRQIIEKGWSIEHDIIGNNDEQLAQAAALYALPKDRREYEYSINNLWPWDKKWYKPSQNDDIESRIQELAKAGALIAAEIDRLQCSHDK